MGIPLQNPAKVILRLLNCQTIDHPLDYYPAPWLTVIAALKNTTPIPELRQQTFQRIIPTLPPDDRTKMALALNALQQGAAEAFRPTRLTHRQTEVLHAVEILGPSPLRKIATLLNQDRSNTFRRLQVLVSLGLLQRHRLQDRVTYQKT